MGNQSKAEGYSVAKREFGAFLEIVAARSRSLENWTYPAPLDATIETERNSILAAGNVIRRSLLIIDARLNDLYDAELTP